MLLHDWQHSRFVYKAMMSLGDRTFSAPLYSYGTTVVPMGHRYPKHPHLISV